MNRCVSKLLRVKAIRSFWQVFLYLVTLPLIFLGYCIPKNPTIWVFGNTFGFKDNARYLFEYVHDRHPEINAVWISSWGQDHVDSNCSYSRFSLTGLWFQYRAAIVFVATGRGDLARFTLARSKVVQLWHGIPIKRILLDSPESLPFANRRGVLRALSLRIFQQTLSRYSIVIASSELVQRRLVSAFGLPENQVKITGYPRHDILLENSEGIKKRILYAPTWRSDIQDAFAIVRVVCNLEFVTKIERLGYELWVSIHPLNNELELMLDPDKLGSVKFVQEQDVNVILAQSEILITDYSSIAIDFSLLNRKIIFYAPDSEEYLQARGVYKEFETILLENNVTDCDGILKVIVDDTACSYLDNVSFFRYRDTGARKRIVDMVTNNFFPNSHDCICKDNL